MHACTSAQAARPGRRAEFRRRRAFATPRSVWLPIASPRSAAERHGAPPTSTERHGAARSATERHGQARSHVGVKLVSSWCPVWVRLGGVRLVSGWCPVWVRLGLCPCVHRK